MKKLLLMLAFCLFSLKLFAQIDPNIAKKQFLPRDVPAKSTIEKWASFRKEIQLTNRFFIRHELDLDRLKSLFEYLETNETIFGEFLYRARIQADENPIPLERMRKPSVNLAKNGRAKPDRRPKHRP